MAIKIPIKWENANFTWDQNTFTWDDVFLIQEIADAFAAGEDPTAYINKDEEKKKKFIKILCKVQGTTYEEKKEYKDIKIKAKEIELVIKEVLGINVNINL
tara:strand:- start:11687 stop:11989 length:303 start_codon:yes stop_codon:yes gene_type:complete